MFSAPTFPLCPVHKSEPLSWVCLDPSCEGRVFCAHCIILTHKNVHKSFNEIQCILKDPLYQLVGSDFLLQSDRTKSLRDTLGVFFDSQEDKLRELLNTIVDSITKKFDEVRKGFREDVGLYFTQNGEKLDKIDQQRKEYDEFCGNYFPNLGRLF